MVKKLVYAKTLRLIWVALLAVIFYSLFISTQTTHAASYCSGSYKGRDSCQGYFTGDVSPATSSSGIDDLIEGGTSADTASEFINQIDSALTGSGSQNSVGAAFIIANMLGRDGTSFSSVSNGETWARNNFDTWEELVRAYSNAGYIDWVKSISTASASDMGGGAGWYRNSAWFGDIDDDAFHNKPDETITVIEIVTPGGGHFRLERKCLNLVGTLSKLTPLAATIDPQSLVNGVGSDIIVDASGGSTVFLHRLNVTNYRGMDHDVKYSIQRSINTDESCNAPFSTISTGTFKVNANGLFVVWGPTDVIWDRTTTKRVCQRLNITDRDGADMSGSNPANRNATVRSGSIVVSASSIPSGTIEPGGIFSMEGRISAAAANGNAFSLTYSISYSVIGAPGLIPPAANSSTVTINSTTATIIENAWNNVVIPVNTPAGTTICVTASVTSPTLDLYFTGAKTDSQCLKVVYKPVFSINGGDITAGGKVESSGICGVVNDATIRSWNGDSAAGFAGAGTQLAAYATGGITGFATARSITGADPPSGLAFSNQDAPDGEYYGGFFGAVPCIEDHWRISSLPLPVITLGNIGKLNGGGGRRAFIMGAPEKIPASGAVINPGVQQIIYVAGDLIINGNITYAGRGSWTNSGQVPGVKFVVRDNIYIDGSVTQLDGIYAAGGRIVTCSRATPSGGAEAEPAGDASGSTLFNQCNQKLTINGVFVASKIDFGRTYGTALSGQSAEEFNFLPELWLANWSSEGNSGLDKYDSITALPPIL